MGWFSSVVNAVRGVVRDVVNLVEEAAGFIIGSITSIFLFWVRKKIRIHVAILHPKGGKALATIEEVTASVARLNSLLKQKFNVRVLTYGAPKFEIIEETPPDSALGSECSGSGYLKIEFGEAGSFFSQYADNIPFVCPVTVFIVQSITNNGKDWRGCSSWVATNYVLLTPTGLNDDTTLAHEVCHACFLQHRKRKANLLYHGASRGTSITRWQKWWFRSSRHVNYW